MPNAALLTKGSVDRIERELYAIDAVIRKLRPTPRWWQSGRPDAAVLERSITRTPQTR